MKTAGTLTKDLIDIAEEAGELEQQGADIATSIEGRHDPIIQMGGCIDDALLDKLALVGEPAELSQKLSRRFGDIFDVCSASVFSCEGYSAGGFDTSIAGTIRQSIAAPPAL